MVLTKEKASVEDYMNLPEGGKYQLIDGEIIEMASPIEKHQDLSGEIFAKLFLHTKKNILGKVFSAPFDVHFDEENIFQPDILFVSNERIEIIKKWIYGAPDVVIEILSPTTAYFDSHRKFHTYEKYGVKEYFLVNPEDMEVVGYKPDANGKYKEYFREYNLLKSEAMDCEISLND
ncbi:MAG: Uma2 family endonuclease [Cytophagales bacterium]